MADSDGEYVQDISSANEDDHDFEEIVKDSHRPGPSSRRQPSRRNGTAISIISRGRERTQQRWEGSLQERNAREFGTAGAAKTAEELNRVLEARKRAR
jgi:hypothetical protein